MKLRIYKALMIASFILPGILPSSCDRAILRSLTPFLIDGSNGFMTELIFQAAPLVLP